MDKRLLLSRLERIQTGNIADAMVNLGIPCKTIEGLWPLSYGQKVGINIPVEIGNTQICPGDYIVMDATGIVIIPPQKAEQICNEAERIQQGELKVRKMVEQGASVMNSFAKVFKNDSKE